MLWPAIIRRLSSVGLILTDGYRLSDYAAAARATEFRINGSPAKVRLTLYTWFNLDGLALGALLAIWLRQPWFHRTQLSRIALPLLAAGVALFVFVSQHPLAGAAFSFDCVQSRLRWLVVVHVVDRN